MFTNSEVNELHAEAFSTRVYRDDEWDWVTQVDRHSLGWVAARTQGRLVGFVNVPWDGLVHAWIQDVMVARGSRHRGVGRLLVEHATHGARHAGCEWLHVDFDESLVNFYVDACGFELTSAGVLSLVRDRSN